MKAIIKGLENAIKRLDRLESKINKLRAKGKFPGNPGDPINIGVTP